MHPLQEVTIADALRLAQRALQVGDFRKSIAILEKVLAAQPLLARARFSLGVAVLRCNETARAVAELRRALVLRPLLAAAWRTLALASFDRNGESDAPQRRALLIEPANLEALLNQGLFHAKRGDRKSEATAYRIALLAHPDSAVLSRRAARAFYATEPAKRAILPLSIAKVHGSLSPLDVLNLADCLNRTNVVLKADRLVASVLQGSPTMAPAWSERMETYRRAGKLDAARLAGCKAQICQPENGQTLKRFCRLLMSMPNQPDLLATGRRGLVLDPGSTFVKVALRHHGIRACWNSLADVKLEGDEQRNNTLNDWARGVRSPTLIHMAARFKGGCFKRVPFSHGYVPEFMPPELYSRLIGSIPDIDTVRWGLNNYPDRADVTAPRDVAAWDNLSDILGSDEFRELLVDAMGARAFADRIRDNGFELSSTFRLTLDRKNYALGPHRDHASRFIVCLIYLASPGDPEELGTSVYRPLKPITFDDQASHHFFDGFERLETFAYRPNSCLCFVNHGPAYHGVEPVLGTTTRRLLQYTIYMSRSGELDDPYA